MILQQGSHRILTNCPRWTGVSGKWWSVVSRKDVFKDGLPRVGLERWRAARGASKWEVERTLLLDLGWSLSTRNS